MSGLTKIEINTGWLKAKAPEILLLRGYLSGLKVAGRVIGEYRGFSVKLIKADFWRQAVGREGRILIGVSFSLTKGKTNHDELPSDAEVAMVIARENLFKELRKTEENILEASQSLESQPDNVIVRDELTKKRTLRIAENKDGTRAPTYDMIFVLQF
ncbi:MAG: hypothetical protein PHH14_07880 [Candidatus Margulisbacteria bacterium]|nr:hypothetical protein [Candidatus Margulisiibacteriota bacterium]